MYGDNWRFSSVGIYTIIMAMHHGGDAGWRSKVEPESPSLTILSEGPEFDSEKVKSRILRCFIGDKHSTPSFFTFAYSNLRTAS